MAGKREPEKPNYDIDSVEEEDSSSEEASSDSDPDLTQVTEKSSSSSPAAAKKPEPPSASKPEQKPPSSSEDESESESESDSDPDPELNSIATKNPTKDSEDPVTAAVKRPAEEKAPDAKDAKKSKKAEPETLENKPTADRVPFQRLWSEEDEIAILQGLIDYSTVKKTDPLADLGAFHDFIKKNLHVEVRNNQLQGKIKTLKRKYKNNNVKEKKDGKPRTFTKRHEQKTYELSKSIWGNQMVKDNRIENGIVSPAKGTSLIKSAHVLPMKKSEMDWGSMEERILTTGDKLFEDGKGDEEAKQWSKLKMEKMELYVRYMEVKTLQARVVIERLKSEME